MSENYYYLLMYVAPSEILKVFYRITNCLHLFLHTEGFGLLLHGPSKKGQMQEVPGKHDVASIGCLYKARVCLLTYLFIYNTKGSLMV